MTVSRGGDLALKARSRKTGPNTHFGGNTPFYGPLFNQSDCRKSGSHIIIVKYQHGKCFIFLKYNIKTINPKNITAF